MLSSPTIAAEAVSVKSSVTSRSSASVGSKENSGALPKPEWGKQRC